MNLDPKLREKLINESRKPFKGIRRVIWIALTASAGIGLLIMGFRLISGENVLFKDFGIQITAFLLFLSLLVFDSPKGEED